jgi:hypothetical protein
MNVVEKTWEEHNKCVPSLHNTWTTLNKFSNTLQGWSRDSFSSTTKEIRKLEKRFASLQSCLHESISLQEERELEKRLCELFEREEIMAHQCSRVDWLREGDRNTSFFHTRASARRGTNRIRYLQNADGSKCEDPKQIQGMVRDFYVNLFSSEQCMPMNAILEAIPTKVSAEMNEALNWGYTNNEIKHALFKWAPPRLLDRMGFIPLLSKALGFIGRGHLFRSQRIPFGRRHTRWLL